jgi:hypothetical protein
MMLTTPEPHKFIQIHVDLISNCPANSLDLSVIDNIEGILKSRIAVGAPTNGKEVKKFFQEEWTRVNQDTIDVLIPGKFAWVPKESRRLVS